MSTPNIDSVFSSAVAAMGTVNGYTVEWCGFVEPANRFAYYGHLRAYRKAREHERDGLLRFAHVPWTDDLLAWDLPVWRDWNISKWVEFKADAAWQMREFDASYAKFKAALEADAAVPNGPVSEKAISPESDERTGSHT